MSLEVGMRVMKTWERLLILAVLAVVGILIFRDTGVNLLSVLGFN